MAKDKVNAASEESTSANTYPSEAQIKEWKQKYGSLYQFEVGDKKIILREPQLADLERAQAADPKKTKPYNFNRSIINNCRLYESEGLSNDDKAMLGIFAQLDEIVDIPEAKTKKL